MCQVKRVATTRRTLEQVGHCVAEALSVLADHEQTQLAVDDIEQATALLVEKVLPELRQRAEIERSGP
jgi:hypothetical protein